MTRIISEATCVILEAADRVHAAHLAVMSAEQEYHASDAALNTAMRKRSLAYEEQAAAREALLIAILGEDGKKAQLLAWQGVGGHP